MDGTRWVHGRANFFLAVKPLARLFRRLFLERLATAFAEGVNGHRNLRDYGLPKFPSLAGLRRAVISRCRDRTWSFVVGDPGVWVLVAA